MPQPAETSSSARIEEPDRAAHKFLDFMNRPDIAAQNTNFVWYGSPNKSAEEMINPEILSYPAIYPDEETFAKLEWFENVGDSTQLYSRIWTEISTQ